jgi:hypothetical protein
MIEPTPNLETAVQVKGSLVKSVVVTLTRHGLRAEVLARVGATAAALIRDPPLPTAWIEGRHHNEILQALHDLLGPEELRALNREAVELAPFVRGAALAVLRAFGTSPDTLLARFDRVAGTIARGVIYRWTPSSDSSGFFEVEYPTLQNVPIAPFVATAGALGQLFDLCGVQGTVGSPEWVSNGCQNRARFAMSWR